MLTTRYPKRAGLDNVLDEILPDLENILPVRDITAI
jgi:hypothetical protein